MKLKSVAIKDLTLRVPVIQGGMGVGISLSSLASAVAREGGMGIISAAQPGFNRPNWSREPLKENLLALREHIQKAKAMANGGIIGVNIMRAMKHYQEYVQCCVESGADTIISGAGLPKELPKLLEGTKVRFAPIVSSLKATRVLFTLWKRRYGRVSDFLVIEGPKAGGHLGFSKEEATEMTQETFDQEVVDIIHFVRKYEHENGEHIPVFVGGGVFDRKDIDHYRSLGADGVQMATRFVTTEECDAPDSYKQAYLNAKEEDVTIVQSPVGMPGRAIANPFVQSQKEPITRCFGCLEGCNPKEAPYCITMALIHAATQGANDKALLFCGSNVGRLKRIETVHGIFQELQEDGARS